MIALAVALALVVAAALFTVRLARGRTAFDRLLAAHALAMLGALLAACIAVALPAPLLLDGALAIVLVDAALIVAAVKALRRNSFQPALTPLDETAG